MRDILTKDDFYEIEKICDVYAGWVRDNLGKCCDTAMHYDAFKKEENENPMNASIKSLRDSLNRITEIRNKLEKMRNNK